ncbi:hypothetical protein MKX40_07790 [Paenibacillus sp. FSL R5-0517]
MFHLLQALGAIECPSLILIQLFLVGGYTRMALATFALIRYDIV